MNLDGLEKRNMMMNGKIVLEDERERFKLRYVKRGSILLKTDLCEKTERK